MSRSVVIPYTPNIVPSDPIDLPRYLDDELNRISQALVAQPVALSISDTGVITVTVLVNWQKVFVSVTPEWDVPGGDFDPTTGTWTCPQTGLYQLGYQCEIYFLN